MGLKITLVDESTPWVVAKERLWLTADRDRLVADGDEEAAFLYAGVGKRFPRAEAERYGLLDNAEVVEDEPEVEPVPVEGGLTVVGREPEPAAEPDAEASDTEPEPDAAPVAKPKPKPKPKPRGRPKKGSKG